MRHSLVPDADSAVALDGGVGVCEQVGVDSATGVMTREDGLELDDAIVIGKLNTTQEGGVDTRLAGALAHTRVDTGGVAVPDVDCYVGDSIASRDIDILDLKEDVHAVRVLSLLDVRPHVFANNVVRAGSQLRRQDARGVLSKVSMSATAQNSIAIAEEDRWTYGIKDVLNGSEHVIGRNARVVVVDSLPVLQRSQVTTSLLDATLLPKCLDGLGTALDGALLESLRASGVPALGKRSGAYLGMGVTDGDVPLELFGRVLLAGVGDGAGDEGQAGKLGEGNHDEFLKVETVIIQERMSVDRKKE